jgi:guanylate kinase
MRPGEQEGVNYYYVSREEFEKTIAEGGLLEWTEFVGNYYGTPKKPVIDCLESGGDMILEIDVNGAEQIRKKMPEAISIFIVPPSYDELKRRLIGRGTDAMDVIEKRLASSLSEIARASEYDYVVKNDVIDECVDNILHIIAAQKLKTQQQKELINEVLNKC